MSSNRPGRRQRGASWYPDIQTLEGLGNFIAASRGPGVAGARLALQLIVGNQFVGSHVVDQHELVTDGAGNAVIDLDIGNRCEDFHVRLRVVTNPVNTWLKPDCESRWYFALPGVHVKDTDPLVQYRFHPRVAPISPEAMEAARQAQPSTRQEGAQDAQGARNATRAALMKRSAPRIVRKKAQLTDAEIEPVRRLLDD